jgi:hypothetical protein
MTTFAEGPVGPALAEAAAMDRRFQEISSAFAAENAEPASQPLDYEGRVLLAKEALMAAEVHLGNAYDKYTYGKQPGEEGFIWPARPMDIVAITYAQQRVLQARGDMGRLAPIDPRTIDNGAPK